MQVKYYLFVILSVFFLPLTTSSQTIPADKTTNWNNAGIHADVPVFDTINVLSNGVIADGNTPNNIILKAIMDANPNYPMVYYFPPGDYFFDSPIFLQSGQVLKGASSDETKFIFDLGTEDHAIIIKGESTGITANITNNISKEASDLIVDGTSAFQVGDFIRTQTEDIDLVFSAWAEHSTGQICQIKEIQGNNIIIKENIRKNILLLESPLIEKINPIKFTGIECLHIERMDATDSQTSNIYFSYAANCWVKGVSSHNGNFAHVDIENGSHIWVTGCHLKDAHAYGDGGQGYGVVLEYNTSDCLVDNNIFDHLRHSILLQAGANGNVLSYNYSINPFWTEVGLPEDSAGDLLLHGNYPYLNLFEGNIGQNIVIDDSHGINGPGNLFLRNRAEHYGIFMNSSMPSDGQVFIGNEVTSTSLFLGFYDLAGIGHFEYGNNVKGNIIPAGTTSVSLNSLYLNEVPDFFEELNLDIASIGLPNSFNTGIIPAKERLLLGVLTKCKIEEPVIIDNVINIPAQNKWNIYPNPTSGILNIESQLNVGSFKFSIKDLNGITVLINNNSTSVIDVSKLNNGLYILIIENNKERYFEKINITD